ncbi:MAG TPA: hypothetical protein PKX91_05705 [Clostridia bacterium]|jgi:V/A-type H+-transporting ATPase subunit G/H|nr:hypothetical protein [Clostridia bacterium]
MIEETLKAVLEAEDQAEEIVKQALEDAKETVAHADDEAEKIRTQAIEKVNSDRKSVVAQANSDANLQFDEIIKAESKKCTKLKKDTKKEDAISYINDKLFEKYGLRSNKA